MPEDIRAVAKAVRDAYRAGRVELAQQRNGNGFDYICQKRRVIEPPEAPMMMRGRMTVLNYDISIATLSNLGKFIHG